MSSLLPVCQDDRRRAELRRSDNLNGIDYVEVVPTNGGKSTLQIYFLRKLPDKGQPALFELEHIVIEGGHNVTDLRAEKLSFHHEVEDAYDDYAEVVLDHEGDRSSYTLRLAARGDGPPAGRPLPGIDPRYSAATFSFGAGRAVEIDCAPAHHCPMEELSPPELNYLAKDYASFRQLLLDRLAQTAPTWRERHSPDLYLTLIELLAYIGDQLSYYQDAVATEAYLATARRRISVRRHARLIDYHMHEGCNARAWLCLEVEGDPLVHADEIAFLTCPAGSAPDRAVLLPDDLRHTPRSSYELFEPVIERRSDAVGECDLLHPRRLLERIADTTDQRIELAYVRLHLSARLPLNEQIAPEELPARVALLARLLDRLLDDPGLTQTNQDALAATLARHDSLNALRGGPLRRHNRLRLEEVFAEELAQPMTLSFHEAHNRIDFYTWGQSECHLPAGATSATLVDAWEDDTHQRRVLRDLCKGDVLIFEEVIGPRTGSRADADPRHRHAVRLNEPRPGVDPLNGQLVVEVSWDPADALPFALCLSTIGPAPECALLERLSVARGNVVLIDHGESVREPDAALLHDGVRTIFAMPFEPPFDYVPVAPPELRCDDEGRLDEAFIVPGRYEPALARSPLVFCESLPAELPPASRALRQDPRAALPQVALFSPARERPRGEVVERQPVYGQLSSAALPYERWSPRHDLLASGRDDLHFVVEVDDEGRALLRFGDNVHGERPPAGERFLAAYRVGEPLRGNVAAETICRALLRGDVRDGAIRALRNPLPAQGGVAAETLDNVRLHAPQAFRSRLMRAIIADDYEAVLLQPVDARGRENRLAEHIQRASAKIAPPDAGSCSQVKVLLDPRGAVAADKVLRDAVTAYLEPFRRIGHNLTVEWSEYVPLELALHVLVQQHTSRGQVRAALLDRLGNRDFPGGRGHFHPDNWSFGQGVAISPIVALARAVPGVVDAQVTHLRRYGQTTELPDEGMLAIDEFEIARLDNDPDNPEHGRIIFKLEGGR